MNNGKNKNSKYLVEGMFFCFCLLIAFEVVKFYDAEADLNKSHIYSLITSAVGSALFVLMIFYSSYSQVLRINIRALPRNVLFILPCLAVAVNNFPIIPFFGGKAYITGKGSEILLYFLVCLGTGLFEELVFRGYIFMIILEKKKGSVNGIFVSAVASSAVFGIIHIMNIFAGADPFATVLQVGYSFLVGGMCAVVLVKTGTVWYPVFIHAIYNFAGGVVPRFGGGTLWDAPTVIITVLLSVFALIYLVCALKRTETRETDILLCGENRNGNC